MESERHLRRKYEALTQRSFKTKLETFLFNISLKNQALKSFSSEDFHRFEITNQIIALYEESWQLLEEEKLSKDGPQMQDIDNFIQYWHTQNTHLEDLIFKEYKVLFQSEYFPYSEFTKLYDQDPINRICHYCKITDKDIELLRNQRKIKTKQFRGYSMEIDRINSNLEYRAENVVLACYWCNNAKSDEFTSREFSSHVGPGISRVWEERLSE